MPDYAVACVLNNPDAVGHSRMIEKSSSDFAGSIATLTHFCAWQNVCHSSTDNLGYYGYYVNHQSCRH